MAKKESHRNFNLVKLIDPIPIVVLHNHINLPLETRLNKTKYKIT